MLLNPYSVLALFVSALEALLGLAIVVGAVRLALRRRRVRAAGATAPPEDLPLLAWAGMVLVGLSVASWPLLYFLLESYVGMWPGVMCIQGVTRVGTGSLGPAGLLPGLLGALQVTKPALVFLAGAWLVLHVADRRSRTGPLAGRLIASLALLGAVATADALLETTYLVVPKQEQSLSAGCCSLHGDDPEELGVSADDLRAQATPLTAGHFGLSALVAVGIGAWAFRPSGAAPAPGWAPALVAAAAASVPVGIAFFARVAAPAFLGRPDHPCPYCALCETPESIVGAGLFLLGPFAVGWAGVAAWGALHPETRPALPRQVKSLLTAGLFGYAAAALFAAVGLAIA